MTVNKVRKTEAQQPGELSPLWEAVGGSRTQFGWLMKKPTGYVSLKKRVLN